MSKTNNTRQVDTRRSFLLTYSQADLTKYSDCKAFSELVLEAMKSVKSTRQIKEWACCQEKHSDGGTHYRMSVNLSGTRRWQPIKNHVYENTTFTKTPGFQLTLPPRIVAMLPPTAMYAKIRQKRKSFIVKDIPRLKPSIHLKQIKQCAASVIQEAKSANRYHLKAAKGLAAVQQSARGSANKMLQSF